MTAIWKEDGRANSAIITAAVLSSLQPGLWGCGVIICPSFSQCYFLQPLPLWLCSCGIIQLQSQMEGKGRDRERKSEPRALRAPTDSITTWDRKGSKRAKGLPTVTSSKQGQGWDQNPGSPSPVCVPFSYEELT